MSRHKLGSRNSFSTFVLLSNSRCRERLSTHSIFTLATLSKAWKQSSESSIQSSSCRAGAMDIGVWCPETMCLCRCGITLPKLPRRVWRGWSLFSSVCEKLVKVSFLARHRRRAVCGVSTEEVSGGLICSIMVSGSCLAEYREPACFLVIASCGERLYRGELTDPPK